MVSLNYGKDKHKQDMANWALEAAIETSMKFTQNYGFNNNMKGLADT